MKICGTVVRPVTSAIGKQPEDAFGVMVGGLGAHLAQQLPHGFALPERMDFLVVRFTLATA